MFSTNSTPSPLLVLLKVPIVGIRVGSFRNILTTGRKIRATPMECHLGIGLNMAPLFDGIEYEIWSIRMKAFFWQMGYDVWKLVVTSYTPPKIPLKSKIKKGLKRNNKLEMDSILEGLLIWCCKRQDWKMYLS